MEREARLQRERDAELALMYARRHHTVADDGTSTPVEPRTPNPETMAKCPPSALFPDTAAPPAEAAAAAAAVAAAAAAATARRIDYEPEGGAVRRRDKDLADGGEHRSTAVDDDDDGGYGGYGVNPGESIIYREMREQKRREDELRRHWAEMGIKTLQPDNDKDGDENDRRNDFPNASEIRRTTATKTPPPSELLGGGLTNHYEGDDGQAAAVTKHNRKTEDGGSFMMMTTAAVPSKMSDTVETASEKPPTHLQLEGLPASSGGRVRPLEDVDDDGREAMKSWWNVHDSETPIEREIRAAREREDALRRSRGHQTMQLSASASTYDGDREVEIITPRTSLQVDLPPPTPAADRAAMKKISESRMKMELRRERERELELRQSGMINTTSEERAGESIKYVEVISKGGDTATTNGGGDLPVWSRSQKAATRRPTPIPIMKSASLNSFQPPSEMANGSLEPLLEVPNRRQQPEVGRSLELETEVRREPDVARSLQLEATTSYRPPKVGYHSPEAACQNGDVIDAAPPPSATTTKKSTAVVVTSPTSFAAVVRRKELPPVLRTFSYPYLSALDDPDLPAKQPAPPRLSRADAQLRVLQEVAEVERREMELR